MTLCGQKTVSDIKNGVRLLLKFASRTDIFFYLLLWLMILLVTGTIAQKDIGLYQAQQRYFSSSILWFVGFLPLPGGDMTMGLIFVNLLAKLLGDPWTSGKAGIIITHVGVFLLLLGGFLRSEEHTSELQS